MAGTLTANDALNVIGLRYPRLLTDGFGARFADEVQAMIWNRYPWRGSLAELPPFHLIANTPDYGPPLLAVPGDFDGIYEVWLREGNGYGIHPLIPMPSLPISFSSGFPTAIAYQKEVASFRLHPYPDLTAPYWWVEGSYKKLPTKITNANINSYLLPWEDKYFQVFKKGLLWKYKDEIMEAQDADRALKLFLYLIDAMAEDEGFQSGVNIIHPANSLEMGG